MNRKIFIRISLIIIFWLLFWTSPHNLLFLLNNRSCSFDDIDVCQNPYLTKRTLVYMLCGCAGFGNDINQLLAAFAYSVATKRRFIIDDRLWNYGNFTDHFRLPSGEYYVNVNRFLVIRNDTFNNQTEHLIMTRLNDEMYQFWFAVRFSHSLEMTRPVAQYVWKSISKQTLEFIQQQRIQNLSNYIGIHIRRGDKKIEAREIPLNDYISTLEKLIHNNQMLPNIFVASDDHSVIDKLHQMKPTWKFLNLFNNSYRMKSLGHFQKHFNSLSAEQKFYETNILMTEIQMLIDAKYLVCGVASSICRLVQLLRYQHPSTAISLNRAWHET